MRERERANGRGRDGHSDLAKWLGAGTRLSREISKNSDFSTHFLKTNSKTGRKKTIITIQFHYSSRIASSIHQKIGFVVDITTSGDTTALDVDTMPENDDS